MGKIIKPLLYAALTIIFLLLMADFFHCSLISHNNIIPDCENPDFSKFSEHFHLNYFEDEIPYAESAAKSYYSEFTKDFFLIENPGFNSIFYSKIWRPPKNS